MRIAAPLRALLCMVAGACLAPALVVAITAARSGDSRVYSLATVQAGLAREPRDWVNRTVRVRAVATGCTALVDLAHLSPCAEVDGELYDRGASNRSAVAPVADGTPDPWLSILRSLPLLGSLAPPAQRLYWNVPALYAVRFRLAPSGLCGAGICVTAVLLDAAPDFQASGCSLELRWLAHRRCD